jgi:aspartyl-tRNA(Asn)/glutamyl-tRNA(Gln) amidotransferase subunit A
LTGSKAIRLPPRIYARATGPRPGRGDGRRLTRAKAGLRKGLLDGVPVSWKDLFDTAGVATEAGSALLKGRTPDRDAACWKPATLQGWSAWARRICRNWPSRALG